MFGNSLPVIHYMGRKESVEPNASLNNVLNERAKMDRKRSLISTWSSAHGDDDDDDGLDYKNGSHTHSYCTATGTCWCVMDDVPDFTLKWQGVIYII